MEIRRTLADLYLPDDSSRISYLDIISGKAEVVIQLTDAEIQEAYNLRHEELYRKARTILRKKSDLTDNQQIGRRIRTRRRELDMTQEDLAQLMGIQSRANIAHVERGRKVSKDMLVRYAEALDTSVGYLLGYSETNSEQENQK